MKRALLLAALVGIGAPSTALANPLFSVQQATPSSIQFTGTGTATFNSSKGDNNQFNVGSSTNLGVNASLSATNNIAPVANAELLLDVGTSLQQTTGTSAANVSVVNSQQSALAAAQQVANSSSYGSSYSNTWGAEWGARTETGQTQTNAQRYSGSVEVEAKAAWKAGWENTYKNAYNTAYAATQTSTTGKNTDGVIKGTFTQTESGSTAAQAQSFAQSAQSSADLSVGTYTQWKDRAGNSGKTEADYNVAYAAAFENAYSAAKSAAGYSNTSTVEVQGLGSTAKVASAVGSTFKVNLVGDNGGPNATETANGSAGANLSTSSYATQSSAATASGFFQAFSNSSPSLPPQ